MRRRAPLTVLVIVGALVLVIGASLLTYHYVLADFADSGEPHCGGG